MPRYSCGWEGCSKSYTKPCRLAEHVRSHTGERPYVCGTCGSSYLRETHLSAHARSHKPNEDRPIVCTRDDCDKRFWTNTQLKNHITAVHDRVEGSEGKYACTECPLKYRKHKQLRDHISAVHATPGTKGYPCLQCDKSFDTSSKLRSHSKVHDDSRYICLHPAHSVHPKFPTWSALRAHTKEEHPPTCHHPECENKVFASNRSLKLHLANIHGQPQESGEEMETDDDTQLWHCDQQSCSRSFKSADALQKHIDKHSLPSKSAKTLICPHLPCDFAARKQKTLDRHIEKNHASPTQSALLDILTGVAYHTSSIGTAVGGSKARDILCQVPGCEYRFGREYDLNRHLASYHSQNGGEGMEFDMENLPDPVFVTV